MDDEEILRAIFGPPRKGKQQMTKEHQYAGIFGEYAPGEYGIGDQVVYDSGESAGTVIWAFVNANAVHTYVVDDGSGWPVEVEARELAQSREQ